MVLLCGNCDFVFAFNKKDITNGILLSTMPDIFYRTCREIDAKIRITPYNISYDRQEYRRLREYHRVDIKFKYDILIGEEVPVTEFYNMKYNAVGTENSTEMRKVCTGTSPYLYQEGKVYECHMICASKHVAKAFGVEFHAIEGIDYLSLEKVQNVQEILDFFDRPKAFCRYCSHDPKRWKPWKIGDGKLKREDWLVE